MDTSASSALPGAQSSYSTGASDLLSGAPPSALQEFYLEQQESIYASHQKEPLGRSAQQIKGSLPSRTKDPKFRFGSTTQASEPAGSLIYAPADTTDRPNPAKERRKYDWAKTGVDPSTYSFGQSKETHSDHADMLLQPHKTKIGSIGVIEKQKKSNAAGVVRASVPEHMRQNHVFGKARSPVKKDEWGASQCIVGVPVKEVPTTAERLKAKRALTAEQKSLVFGTSSVRKDKAPPKMRSVTDSTNYGDEDHGQKLIQPSRYAHFGVDDKEFTTQRQDSELREIFKLAGMECTDDEFAALAQHARKEHGTLSVESFRSAWNKFKLGLQ